MKLADYLAAQKLTREAFAQRLGVHSVTVSKWCSGAMRPSWPMISRVAAETGNKVTAADFMPDPAPAVGIAALPAAE